ncbi:MAG: sulfite exporter TauE/SafE family protein [Pseudomonadota bacterium]
MITIFGFEAVLDARFGAMMVIVFFAGIIRGFTGFGSALLSVPALAVLYGPELAVVIEVLIEIPVSIGLLPAVLRQAERRTVLPMLGMFAIFVPVGTLLLTTVDPIYVKAFISIFVLISVWVLWQQARFVRLVSPRATYLVGAISGTTQGLAGIAGPLFATAMVARGESGGVTRANISALAAGIIVLSVTSFYAFGLLTAQTLFYAALASPAILLGVWVGSVLFHRSSISLRPVILWFLVLTAVVTLVDALP